MNAKLAVLILTHNEAIHLPRALASVASLAHSIHIVDSGSSDDTIALAEAHGAEVLRHAWKNYADQFQFGLDHITTDATWILRLDADEIVEADLAARIGAELAGLDADVVGIHIDRKHIFLGRWIKYGGRYPLTLLRLFRRGNGRIEQRWMDEHIVVSGGRTVHFAGGFADHNLKGLSFFIDKHNFYATREAIDVLNRRHGLFLVDADLTAQQTSRHTATTRWIKQNVYNSLPFPIASLGYFFYRYFWQLGFVDGPEGLIYHVLQGYWYRFLVGAKVLELERAIAHLQDKDAIRQELARLTGLRV